MSVSMNINNNSYNNGNDNNYAKINKAGGICKSLWNILHHFETRKKNHNVFEITLPN